MLCPKDSPPWWVQGREITTTNCSKDEMTPAGIKAKHLIYHDFKREWQLETDIKEKSDCMNKQI